MIGFDESKAVDFTLSPGEVARTLRGAHGPVGESRWGGAAGTAFWIDSKDAMISVLMTQGAPGPARGYTNTLFRQMVRQAIVD